MVVEDMVVVLFFVVMLGLLVFMIWDRRRPVAPPTRAQIEKGWKPGEHGAALASVVLSLTSASLGLMQWFDPELPPFHGRGAFLQGIAHELWGPKGSAVLWWILSVVLVIPAVIAWRATCKKSQSQS
ncbi:MAG: hypothetical protein ACT6SF_12820 [Hydrogenophaga sp.]|uniref:hypothetical protein n=1 Tax=Hydrogenophaga sp. TaxID=1904254 RepID=UPI004037341B